jgi:hypothetical protein
MYKVPYDRLCSEAVLEDLWERILDWANQFESMVRESMDVANGGPGTIKEANLNELRHHHRIARNKPKAQPAKPLHSPAGPNHFRTRFHVQALSCTSPISSPPPNACDINGKLNNGET